LALPSSCRIAFLPLPSEYRRPKADSAGWTSDYIIQWSFVGGFVGQDSHRFCLGLLRR